MADDRFANPFAKVRRLDPDNAQDRAMIRRFFREQEPDPEDADDLALGVVESIRDGEATMSIEDDVVVLRTSDGVSLSVPFADIR